MGTDSLRRLLFGCRERAFELVHTCGQTVAVRRGLRQLAIETGPALLRLAQDALEIGARLPFLPDLVVEHPFACGGVRDRLGQSALGGPSRGFGLGKPRRHAGELRRQHDLELRQPRDLFCGRLVIGPDLREDAFDLADPLAQTIAIRGGLRQLPIGTGPVIGEEVRGVGEGRLVLLLRPAPGGLGLGQLPLEIGARGPFLADLVVELRAARDRVLDHSGQLAFDGFAGGLALGEIGSLAGEASRQAALAFGQARDLGDGRLVIALSLCEGVLDITHPLDQTVAIGRGLRQLPIEAGLMLGEFGGGGGERCLVPFFCAASTSRSDIGARLALVADLPVELCLSRRGFPGRRQALERRARVRVSKCGFRRREPAFQIAVARPDVRERRVQIRLACGEALHLGNARFVIVPGRAERCFQLEQPRLEVGHGRRVADLRILAGTDGLRKFGFDGDSPVQLGIDRGLELALPFGELSGGIEPFLCRTRRGGFMAASASTSRRSRASCFVAAAASCDESSDSRCVRRSSLAAAER